MTLETAKKHLQKDIYQMNISQLQKHQVHLIDAWRESRAEYGMRQAIQNGFYVPVPELNSFIPAEKMAGNKSVPQNGRGSQSPGISPR